MNSFELNKIFGAILGTLVLVMGVGFIAEEIYAPIEERGATFELPEPEGAGGEGGEQIALIAPISIRMQDASAEAGADIIVRCQSCHDYSEANTNRVGPGLWNIVDRPIASHEGFNYSEALVALADAEQVWNYQHLDEFIESPQTHAPGTTMSFPGLADPDDRANLIAFLREQADTPAPLPEPTEEELAAMSGGAAEGEGEAAAEAAPAGPDYATLIANADVDFGLSIAARCQGCHDFSPANETRVGPGLYDVVNRPIAGVEGYGYSAALVARGEAGEVWDFAHLDGFITNPREHTPGTTMGFAGIANEDERIALIAWMREQSDNPVELEGAAAAGEDTEAPTADDPAADAVEPVEEVAAPAAERVAPLEEIEADAQEQAAENASPAAEEPAAETEEPVVEVEAPQSEPVEAPVTQVPGAGQEAGDIDTSPVNEGAEPVADEAAAPAADADAPVVADAADDAAADEAAAATTAAADEDADATAETADAEGAPAGEGSGFITAAQVTAGRTAYEQNCATCHGQDIVSSIAGYPNAGLFFSYISTAMPASAPGSLPQQRYADIIAYLLSENGHPEGTEILPPDRTVLNEIDPDAFAE